MRLIAFAVVALVLGWVVASMTILRPPEAVVRLADIQVQSQAYTIGDLAGQGRHQLSLSITITSDRDLDECMAFALDEPVAGRQLRTVSGECIRPRAGSQTASLVFDALTDFDLSFPSHTLVWGVPGGRCGLIRELLGDCAVDVAGTAPLQLPPNPALPTFGPPGSFVPFGSFQLP